MTKEALRAAETFLTEIVQDADKPDKIKLRAVELLLSLPSESELDWTV